MSDIPFSLQLQARFFGTADAVPFSEEQRELIVFALGERYIDELGDWCTAHDIDDVDDFITMKLASHQEAMGLLFNLLSQDSSVTSEVELLGKFLTDQIEMQNRTQSTAARIQEAFGHSFDRERYWDNGMPLLILQSFPDLKTQLQTYVAAQMQPAVEVDEPSTPLPRDRR